MECSISKNFSIIGLNCWFNSYVESSELSKQYITKKIELHFGNMTNDMVKKLPQETELKQKLKVTLKSLFKHKIIFLLKDIDKVLNSIILDSPLKTIIGNKLIQIDQVILNIFQQHNKSSINTDLNKYFYIRLDDLRKDFRLKIANFLDDSKYFSELITCKIETTFAPITQNKKLVNKNFSAKTAPFNLEISSIAVGGPAPVPIASATGNVTIEDNKNERSSNLDSVAEPIFCYQQLGLKSPPETWEYSTIYDLKKCKVLNSLTPQTPIKQILNVYVDLKAWAANMVCIQRGAGYHATQHYVWDWLEFGYLYNLWYIYQ
ncbi:hypothetical protein QUF74_00325 [Candidatus Halobeggiatoa sp. HSG11]|nr:hypothetical protein [Candidatus Halobeggiatoa sp. HSG11]